MVRMFVVVFQLMALRPSSKSSYSHEAFTPENSVENPAEVPPKRQSCRRSAELLHPDLGRAVVRAPDLMSDHKVD